MGSLSYFAALLAGALSTLSPCVLPLVPIILGAALQAHRHGMWALAVGLALSFTLTGTLIASVGFAVGINQGSLRVVAAVLFVVMGLVMWLPTLQTMFSTWTSRFSARGHAWLDKGSFGGLGGQLMIGLALGVVWTPCTGPTLGAAITLASQGEQLSQVVAVMSLFGMGAALPLIAVGTLSRHAFARWRGGLLSAGAHGKKILGAVFVVLGVAILSGVDKSFEAWINAHVPDWWIVLTTSI